jgi:hypothetical protein
MSSWEAGSSRCGDDPTFPARRIRSPNDCGCKPAPDGRSDTRPIGSSIRKIRNDVSIAGRDVFVALFYNFMTPTAGEGPSHGRARPVRCANQHIPRLRPLCFFDFQENSKIQSKLLTKSPINKLISPSNPCELAPIVTLQTSKKYPSRKRLPFHFCYMSRWRKCYPSHKTIPSH